MLVKTFLVGATLLLAAEGSGLAGVLPMKETPKPTQPKKSERVPQSGTFPDGTTFMWMCEEGMKGSVKILIITPEGLQLPAEVPCVSPTEKNI